MHPTSGTWEGTEYSHPVHHEISLMCDDIAATKAELEAKGAVFDGDISDDGFGLTAIAATPRRRPDPALRTAPPHRLRPDPIGSERSTEC